MIDWNDPKCRISKYFTVKEATYLPSWDCYHTPSEAEVREILILAERMDSVRDELGKPIHVNCWIRPTNVNSVASRYHGKNYNAYVGGRPGSAHIEGKAVDFHVSSWMVNDVKEHLLPLLQELNLRMENNPNGNWIHLDTRNPLPKQSRYFRP